MAEEKQNAIETLKETGATFLRIAPGFVVGACTALGSQWALWWFLTHYPAVPQ